jgi:hypothetical protein
VLLTVEEFHKRVRGDLSGLVIDLQWVTGRQGRDEEQAWSHSLRALSRALQGPSFRPLHLYFGGRGHLSLEYQLPAASSWCDVVLLGAHAARASAVMLELKHWSTRNDRPGRCEGLIERQGVQELHPSDQVRGYVEYCRRFHSAVEDHRADVHGCVLLTNDVWASAYGAPPNDDLAARFPLFTLAPEDLETRFPAFFSARLSEPDERFARAFEDGRYRQNRGFVAQIGAQILDPATSLFELLDNQRKAFTFCRAIVEDAFLTPRSAMPPKKVVIINGPPGSGKSVIAARLWASLVTDARLPTGDVVFTTTSMSQTSNWGDLFRRAARSRAARGVVRRATACSPVTPQRLGQLRKRHGRAFLEDAERWRANLETLRALGEPLRDGARDNQNLVSIVDEAHGLINPERPRGRGNFGFAPGLGPLGYHIIRSSILTVFLLDPQQGFRERENTTIADLRKWAHELGAGEPEEISLDGAQFRCAGSVEFVTWVEAVLAGANAARNEALASTWKTRSAATEPSEPLAGATVAETRSAYPAGDVGSARTPPSRTMGFSALDSPAALESALRERQAEGYSVRLLSSYSREWKTRGAANPHALDPRLMDFHEPYTAGGRQRFWSRIWNFVPHGTDYTWYVAARPGSRMAADPLCEVGCPYAVRGFDFDYVGILWLNDLVWRHGEWRVDAAAVEESGVMELTRQARREQRLGHWGPATTELRDRVLQAYRILFTRALRGVYVWVPDAETRGYLLSSLG